MSTTQPTSAVGSMTHDFQVHGMHCQACVNRVGAALRGVPGVTSADVSLNPPTARVTMSRHVSTAELDRVVRSAGDYRLTDARHADAGDAPDLVSIAAPGATGADQVAAPKESLYPLLLIVGYLVGAVAVIAWHAGTSTPTVLMRQFMAGFFLVFSFFKLLDLRGFADAYRSYDVVARAIPAWAFVYPFVELALGVAYLVNFRPMATNTVTLVVMLVGAVGVLQALLDKRAIRCACLGTALNLPMTTVTLVEDLAMAGMAAVMLAMG